VTAKAFALVISSILMFLVVGVVSMLVFLAIESQIETEMMGIDMFRTVLMSWPLVFAVGMLSLFLAAFCAQSPLRLDDCRRRFGGGLLRQQSGGVHHCPGAI
jgi:hypothetical protein